MHIIHWVMIYWVVSVTGQGGIATNTVTFNTEAACQAAVKYFYVNTQHLYLNRGDTAFCVSEGQS